MESRRRGVKPEDLMDMRDHAAALALSMNGQFDERIVELRKAKEELDATQLVVRTLAEAEQIKHAAVQFATTARGEVEGIEARAEEHRLDIMRYILDAKAIFGRAQQEKDLTASGWIELEREVKRVEAANDKREAEYKRRSEILAEKEASVAGELDKLRLLQAQLHTRLKKLEEVV